MHSSGLQSSDYFIICWQHGSKFVRSSTRWASRLFNSLTRQRLNRAFPVIVLEWKEKMCLWHIPPCTVIKVVPCWIWRSQLQNNHPGKPMLLRALEKGKELQKEETAVCISCPAQAFKEALGKGERESVLLIHYPVALSWKWKTSHYITYGEGCGREQAISLWCCSHLIKGSGTCCLLLSFNLLSLCL